jgi:ribose 5-phosphate isomerase A
VMDSTKRRFEPYDSLHWPSEISNRAAKETVAAQVAELVRDGQVVGVGSGTTSFLAVVSIAARVHREGLTINAVPTSLELEWYCKAAGLRICDSQQIDLAFDGADEVDPKGALIKGRGGALLRERRNLDRAAQILILVDSSKFVPSLGTNFPVPVEVSQTQAFEVARDLAGAGFRAAVRLAGAAKDGPVVTESGNVLLDVRMPGGIEASMFDIELRKFGGVVDTGLFLGYTHQVVTAS